MNEKELSSAKAETEKPSYWAVLPAAVRYDPTITAGARLLYAEISSLTDALGYCWASNSYFQQLYGISEPTVQRYLRALKAGGYIRIQDGDGGQGRRKIYSGVNPLGATDCHANAAALARNDKSGNPVKNDEVTPSKLTPNPVKNDTQNKKEIRKENDPPVAPQGAEAEIWDKPAWERFWAMYPRKVDKAKAIRAWNRLRADRKLMQTMSAALKAQKASEEWRRDNGRAIPYPSTWLNNRRWEDEVRGRAAEGVGPYRTDDREEDDVLRI